MKFSIRDLMFVTVIVAILVAWWVDRRDLVLKLKGAKSHPHPDGSRPKGFVSP